MAKNECGADGVFTAPNSIFGVKINSCCITHDAAYRKGGTKADRKKADICFLKDMIKRGVFKPIAYIYYFAVRAYGWLCWNKK